MTTKRNLLEQAPLGTLRQLVRRWCLEPVDTQSREAMLNALVRARRVTLSDLETALDLEPSAPKNSIKASANPLSRTLSTLRSPQTRTSPATRRDWARPHQRNTDPLKSLAHPIFVAIDFETADRYRDSACAVALVRVEGSTIVKKEHFLIRPPRQDFEFTYIHGITYAMVRRSPTFGQVWPELEPWFRDIDFLVAHNASFDRSVMATCCDTHGLTMPKLNFLCTVRIARNVWDIYPTKLPNVCDALGIALDHHQALSDAEASARILIAAMKDGFRI